MIFVVSALYGSQLGEQRVVVAGSRTTARKISESLGAWPDGKPTELMVKPVCSIANVVTLRR